MAKYDVYVGVGGIGYMIDVQSEILDGLNSRVMVPLILMDDAPMPAKRLNPVFMIDGVNHVMVTQFLASVPPSILKDTVGNLSDRHDEITNALDMVFQGF